MRFVAIALLGAFFSAATALGAAAHSPWDRHFYVGSHGWHTSIIVERSSIRAGLWPRGIADRTFARYRYLEIGWGDRKFYTAPKPGVAMAIDAAFSAGPSVLHIVGLQPPITTVLPWSAIVEIPCTRAELENLCRALGQSFDVDARGAAREIGNGLYGETSRFYPARGKYYLFNTCDTWTARMMKAGGLAARTDPISTGSAGSVIAQARRLSARRTRSALHP